MSELLEANIAGLLCAGAGSRLRKGLMSPEFREVEQVDVDKYQFTRTGQPYEKSLVEIVPPDPRVDNDLGVTILDLAVKDMLLIPSIDTIRFLTNETSNIPKRYKEAIDRASFLGRLGLPSLGGSEMVNVEYLEQPAKTDEYPYYGTAWAFYLVSRGVQLANNKLMMITETDSAYYGPGGLSVPAQLIASMQDNPRGATAGLAVAPIPETISRDNGMGMCLLDKQAGTYYFTHVIESGEHANDWAAAAARSAAHGRNTTRVAADSLLLSINDQVAMRAPTLAANKGERQATDTYNARAEKAAMLAYTNPAGTVWRDSGEIPGLVLLRNDLGGLQDAQNPVWGPARAA